MANLYFCTSATADNYIVLDCGDAIYTTNCADTDGVFAGVDLAIDIDESADGKAAAIRAALGTDIADVIADMAMDADNGAWGDAITTDDGKRNITMAEFVRANDGHEPWQQDKIIRI